MSTRPVEEPVSLLTADEAGERLRCSGRTIRRMIRAGELAAVRVGRRWLVDESDLPRPRRLAGDEITPRPRAPRRERGGRFARLEDRMNSAPGGTR